MPLRIENEVINVVHANSAGDERPPFEQVLEQVDESEIVIEGRRYRVHPNGGGLVSITAFVASTVYVAETARVEDFAVVLDAVRINRRAVVGGHAVVTGGCSLSGDSRVGGAATLIGAVALRRHAQVDGTARLEGGIVVDCVTHISRGHLYGPLYIG